MSLMHLNSQNFADVTAQGTVLIDFYADWCGPCKAMAPRLEAFAAARPDVQVVKVDVDAQPELAKAHDIRSIPTLVAYHDGSPGERAIGLVDRGRLESLVA